MKILFVHQNFPGQFREIAPAFVELGHDCIGLGDETNKKPNAVIKTFYYKKKHTKPDPEQTRLGTSFVEYSDIALAVALAARTLRDKMNIYPDVIYGHSGWGETMFLRAVWPNAKIISYAEYYPNDQLAFDDFDTEFGQMTFEKKITSNTRMGFVSHTIAQSHAAIAPTYFQAAKFPVMMRNNIQVVFDGVKTNEVAPKPDAVFSVEGAPEFRVGDELLTFINRNLEPARGYHIFMRALPKVLKERPNTHVVIIGGDKRGYGNKIKSGTWRQVMLDEVGDQIDLDRVHFIHKLAYDDYKSLIQVSRAHAYLTYPFVLGWSCVEAMSMGAHVIGSATAPVEEFITDGVTGSLVDFFDIEGWSEKLIDALANPEKHNHLREAARAHIVKNYDLKTVCLPKILSILESTINGVTP